MPLITLFVAALLLVLPVVSEAAPLAVVTIVDGEVGLIRESSRYAVTEGVKLQGDDIVETGKGKLVRLEFSDGYVLDLGDDTRVMIAPLLLPGRSGSAVRAYVLRGWAKWTAAPTPTEAALLSASADVSGNSKYGVLAVLGDEVYVFAESGALQLTERRATKAQPAITLKSENFYMRGKDTATSTGSRPPPGFLDRLPRAFRDTLPRRAALFANKDVDVRLVSTITYPDVQAWVDAEPALRRQFVERWRASAADPTFRKGLLTNLKAHPEWERVLFPPKPKPKPVPAPPPLEDATPLYEHRDAVKTP